MSNIDLLVLVFIAVAVVLSFIDLARSKWQALTTWAVLLLALALAIPYFIK